MQCTPIESRRRARTAFNDVTLSSTIEYAFTFGGIPCLVVTTTGSQPIARPYVIVSTAGVLRPLAADDGATLEFVGKDAREQALRHLETRFGVRGPAPRWASTRLHAHAWSVLHDSPVGPNDEAKSLRP